MPVEMAAAREVRSPEVVDLRQVRVAALHDLLQEETAEWQARLGWDFQPSADMVRRFVGLRTLAGSALLDGEMAVGYVYIVSEDRKGLIGDLYLSGPHRTSANEARLLGAALAELFEQSAVTRIEAQLMMLGSPLRFPLPYTDRLRVHPRHFMVIPGRRIADLRPGPAARKSLIEGWTPWRIDEAGGVIAAAYQGHVDSAVNDQYRSVSGARRFLNNILQYPGCGAFFAPASFVALDAWTGRACGMSLASMLSPGVGHITQICVAPILKGKGLGYELLRRSLVALAEAGCHKASLTVTAANADAVRLYERVGFEKAHDFSALVWDYALARLSHFEA
jgi:ribosomal protein S18 acetylase RimI-like enzyme